MVGKTLDGTLRVKDFEELPIYVLPEWVYTYICADADVEFGT